MALAASLRQRLQEIADLSVPGDEQSIRDAERDFGGLAHGTVRAVVRPATVEALVDLVRLARAEGLPLTPRALGYSQSGQSVPIDGLSVDMGAFVGIDASPDDMVARCGSSVSWRQLLAHTAPLGLAPTVMPFNLDLSIGGTLSAGGLGSTSHHHGMAVSSVQSLTVVTGAGEQVVARRDHRADVYDAVLGGIGQFGFICEVELRLRQIKPRTRTFFLLYDDVATLLADERRLMHEPRCTHLEGFASAAVQGLKRGPGGRRMPFARWFYGLHVSTELGPDDDSHAEQCTDGLGYRELVHTEDNESTDYAARYDLRFEMMRATGAWQQPHPWLECMLPMDAAAELIPEVLARLPLVLGDGHRIMPIADVPRPALLMTPARAPMLGLAVLPASIPAAFEAPVMAALREVHGRLVAAGGKRYLSGWLFQPDESAWRTHYGESFELWRARKRELDPDGILQSCLVRAG